LTGEVSDAAGWLDQYDRVVAAAAQHLPDQVLVEVARIARDQRVRRPYDGTVLLVCLAGGTGSGKSSLLNAIASEEVSPSGAIRPTTSEALAWVPASAVSRLDGLFERFGITEVVLHDLDPMVAIVDLPDIDSMEARHRTMLAELLPIIDLVVWVVDPEKYRDRVLHTQHLAPLAMHQDRFRFVVNQIDRVDEKDVAVMVEDLTGALVADGVQDPVIWLAAADPPFGPPIGVEAIWEGLVRELDSKGGGDRSLIAELKRGLGLLEPHVRAVGFGSRWDRVGQSAADLWVAGKKSESIRELRVFLIDLAIDAPHLDPGLDLDSLIGSPHGTASVVARHFDATLGRHLRDRLRGRATTRALAEELALSLPPLR